MEWGVLFLKQQREKILLRRNAKCFLNDRFEVDQVNKMNYHDVTLEQKITLQKLKINILKRHDSMIYIEEDYVQKINKGKS